MEEQLLSLVGGLGVFIYSLRLVMNALDDTGSDSIRGVLERATSKSIFSILIGIFVSILFQASSTAILLTMGLLNRSLIPLHQAALMMLGAAVGTTFKIWIDWDFSFTVGTLLILFSSIGILINWHKERTRALEISLGIGFTILGFHLVVSGLSPMLESPWFLQWIKLCKGSTFSNALIAALFGMLATILVQSSSSVVLITIGLATQGQVSFEGAASIILGANIGTASTGLLVSIGQSISAKRLAFMHLVAKTGGVLFVQLFFKTFLSIISLISPQNINLSGKLALVHTGFNVLNLFFWWGLLPILIRFSRGILPDSYDTEYWLSVLGVQKLLGKMPERAIQEAQLELLHLVSGLHQLTVSCTNLLLESNSKIELREQQLKSISAKFETYEHRLHNIEQVLGKVATQQDIQNNLSNKLNFILGHSCQLRQILCSFKNYLQSLDPRIQLSEEPSTQVRSLVQELSRSSMHHWDRLYQELSTELSHINPNQSAKGRIIFETFFKCHDKNALKTQQICALLARVERELNT